MAATLYLSFDGVLHPRFVAFRDGQFPRLRAAGHEFFENNSLLELVLESCPQTRIVLHTWWVPRLGYWEAVRALPQSVQTHVIGATLRGNRLLRFKLKPASARRCWLEQDLARRQPINPVLLDCDPRQVPGRLLDSSCIVDGWAGLASSGACEALIVLLSAEGSRTGADNRLPIAACSNAHSWVANGSHLAT